MCGTWADFKSLYEPGSTLRGPRNLKNGTWADFKSLYEPGSALRGPRNLKNGTWKIRTVFYECAVLKRVCGHESGKLLILNFLVHNMAIWSVPREPHRNSTHQTRAGRVLAHVEHPFREHFPFWAATAAAATQDHGLPGQVPSPHAPRSEISRSGVPLTPMLLLGA